jgi:glycosyltransferase involved in cell wall biosynthesis
MLSFIIPAHNEERYVGDCIASVTTSARVLRQSFEVIVVDDASTDRTLAIAATHGAKVVKAAHRQDRGYAQRRCARGEWLFFVDADTLANPRALRACLQALEGGAVGGGCVFTFDGTLPVWAKLLYPVAVVLARTFKLMGGCFLFWGIRRSRTDGCYLGPQAAHVSRLGHSRRAVALDVLPARPISAARGFGSMVRWAANRSDWRSEIAHRSQRYMAAT